jgi:hypothetical protein
MRDVAFAFFAAAAFSVFGGMVWGIQMAISGDHQLAPAHAHLNLVGWATLALYGVYYRLTPLANVARLARVHAGMAILGVVVLVSGIALVRSGGPFDSCRPWGDTLGHVGGSLPRDCLSPRFRGTSLKRPSVTSAATADSAAEQRSAGWACWRGNAAGLGGWTFVTRISLATLQATGMGFFGLYGSTAALATTLTLATVVNCLGIGFQRGTHTRWQIVHNDASGAPTLINASSAFTLSTDAVVTFIIATAPNGGSVWVRIVDELSGAVFERELTTDLPASTQFLSPRLYMNNGATAAAVAFDCSGVYVETDF